jgi:hypothetical protein
VRNDWPPEEEKVHLALSSLELTALNGSTRRQDEHDNTTITKASESLFVDVVVVTVRLRSTLRRTAGALAQAS